MNRSVRIVLHLVQHVTADSWSKENPRKVTVQAYLDQFQWPENQLGMDMSPFNKFHSSQLSDTYVSWPYLILISFWVSPMYL